MEVNLALFVAIFVSLLSVAQMVFGTLVIYEQWEYEDEYDPFCSIFMMIAGMALVFGGFTLFLTVLSFAFS